jgi:sugar phosphate isomerase/epimerase
MKHSVFTVCMPEYSVEEAIDRLAAWGFEGVEWRVFNPKPSADGKPGFWQGNRCTIPFDTLLDQAEAIGKRCRAAGLEVAALAPYVQCDAIADVERVFEACVRMGAPQARVQIPGGDGKTNYRALFDKARADYAKVGKLAHRFGVRANLEIHMGTICPSASSAYRLLEGLDPADVGVIHDAGNMMIEGYENWQFGLELLGEYLAEVHVKNSTWVPGAPGALGQNTWKFSWAGLREGRVNWPELIATLKAVGYTGWLSVEDFTTDRPTEVRLKDDLAFLREAEA